MSANPPSHPNNIRPAWACTPRLVLPPDAPTAGYLCGGGGLMTAGFEIAGICSLWNIDHDPSDPKLSSAIAKVYEQNFGHPVIGETLQKVVNSPKLTDLQPPDILVLTQPCKHLSRSNPKAKETSSDISTAEAAVIALKTFLSPVFAVENVPEYQHSTSGSIIKSALAKLGYSYHAQIVNTADYGVPQERYRFIAIATRGNGQENTLDELTAAEHSVGWYEAISDLLPALEDIEPTATQLQKTSCESNSKLFFWLVNKFIIINTSNQIKSQTKSFSSISVSGRKYSKSFEIAMNMFDNYSLFC